MAFHHRKLLDESISDIIATFCKQNCDEPEKFNGTCPSTCFNTCPPNSCKLSIIPIPPLPLLPPPPPPPPPPPVSTHNKSPGLSVPLTASLAVLATAFFIFTCYTIYKFYTVWRNSRRRPPPRREAEEDDDENDDEDVVDHPIWHIRTIGLQPSVINAITVVKYKSADGLVDGTDCAVCLSEFEEDETLRLLPKCSHAFHIPCIDTWLASHTNCPMCRAGIPAGPFPLQEPAAHGSGRAEEVAGSGAEIGAEMDENVQGDDSKIDVDGLQAVRRSVSMDSLSASMISAAVASAFPRQSDKAKVEDRMSSSMKRSASCSAKVFLSRHSSRR